jgi:hypothetical protein
MEISSNGQVGKWASGHENDSFHKNSGNTIHIR